jgi:hypothetical protein
MGLDQEQHKKEVELSGLPVIVAVALQVTGPSSVPEFVRPFAVQCVWLYLC